MITENCKKAFEFWASKRMHFNWNNHTKRLTCHGKYFFDMLEVFQVSAIIEFADSNSIFLELEVFTHTCDINVYDKRMDIIYQQKEINHRHQAHVEFVKWFNNYYNTKL